MSMVFRSYRKLLAIIFLTSIAPLTWAAADPQLLQQQRIETIRSYIKLLGQGDYKQIPNLFTKHAVAVSASGESDSVPHFYEDLLTKTIISPQAKLINIFDGQLKNNMMTAYYNLTWTENGSPTTQKFVDLFVFQADSTKIKTVYVFSNHFQEEVFTPS